MCGILRRNLFLRTFMSSSIEMNVSLVRTVLAIAVVMRSSWSVSIIIIIWQTIIRTLFFVAHSSTVPRRLFYNLSQLTRLKSLWKPIYIKKAMCSSLPRLSEKTTRATARKADEYSHGLNIPGNFRGLPWISSWLGGSLAKHQTTLWILHICPHKKSQPPLPLRVVFDECIPCLGFKSKSRRLPIFEPRNAEVKDGRFNEFMFLLGYDRRH